MFVARLKSISLNYKAGDVLTFAQVTAIRKEIDGIKCDRHYSWVVAESLDIAAAKFKTRILQNDVLASGSPYLELVLGYEATDANGFFCQDLDVKSTIPYGA